MKLSSYSFFAISLSTVLLSSAATVYASGDATSGSPVMDFVWKILNTLILVAILVKFGKKPVSDALGASAQNAKKTIEEARAAERKIERELKEAQEKLSNMERDAEALVVHAKKEAQLEKKRIIKEGEAEVKRMAEQARFTIEQEYKKAGHDLKLWVAGISMKHAEEQLEQRMNPDLQDSLVNQYIQEISASGESS